VCKIKGGCKMITKANVTLGIKHFAYWDYI
jgi:hypothetical protein